MEAPWGEDGRRVALVESFHSPGASGRPAGVGVPRSAEAPARRKRNPRFIRPPILIPFLAAALVGPSAIAAAGPVPTHETSAAPLMLRFAYFAADAPAKQAEPGRSRRHLEGAHAGAQHVGSRIRPRRRAPTLRAPPAERSRPPGPPSCRRPAATRAAPTRSASARTPCDSRSARPPTPTACASSPKCRGTASCSWRRRLPPSSASAW